MRVTKKTKDEMIRILSEVYADAKPALLFRNPFELLVAVILSAQCTDQRVNIVTKRLFAKVTTPEAIVRMGLPKLEKEIHECGFFHAKAKNILATCEILARDYGGKVPEDFDALLALPGVGRKTANVIQAVAFGRSTMAVDTHVYRVSHRLGLVSKRDNTPLKVEQALMANIPDEQIPLAHHWLLLHGRYVCTSQRPKCAKCGLVDVCPKLLEGSKLE